MFEAVTYHIQQHLTYKISCMNIARQQVNENNKFLTYLEPSSTQNPGDGRQKPAVVKCHTKLFCFAFVNVPGENGLFGARQQRIQTNHPIMWLEGKAHAFNCYSTNVTTPTCQVGPD